MPQLGVFSPLQISEWGVYTGLSAGSFHPSTAKLFTVWRLQPFSGLGWVGQEDEEEADSSRWGAPDWHKPTDVERVCVFIFRPVLCVCLESRVCVSSLFGWLKPLVCPSGRMSAAGKADFLSPSICIVAALYSCCSQLVKRRSSLKASTAHKVRVVSTRTNTG